MPLDRTLAAACVLAVASAVAAPARASDLLTIYRLAKSNDPQYAAAQAQYRAEREAKPQARAALLPQLNASAGYSYNNADYGGTSSDFDYRERRYQLKLTQPLFDWSAFAGVDRADAILARAEANLAGAKQKLILRSAQAYFDVLSARDNLRFAKAEKKAIKRQLDQAQQRFDVGLIAITGVKSARASFDLAVAREIKARNDLADAREHLRTLIDRPPGRLAALSTKLPLDQPQPDRIQPWVKRALEQNPDFLAARANSRVAHEQIRQARGGYYPDVDVYAARTDSDLSSNDNGGGVGAGAAASSAGQDSTTNSIGIELQWNLFNGFGTVSHVDEASARYQEAQSRMTSARRSASQRTRNAFRGLAAAISQVKALDQAVVSNQAAVKSERAGFRVGTRTAVDVLQALRDLYRAQRNYSDARYDYIINRLQLKQAAGTLTIDDVRRVNAWLSMQPDNDSASQKAVTDSAG